MKTIALLLLLAAPGSASDFPTFMTGSWASVAGGVKMEEHWTSADGGVMLGTHRDIRSNGKVAFEFLRIEKRDGVLAYVAQPGGRPPTVFPLKSLTMSRVVFENMKHDFPQRILYWRDNLNLCARVEGTMNGKEESEQWCWSPQAR
jgi:hypothetical protein